VLKDLESDLWLPIRGFERALGNPFVLAKGAGSVDALGVIRFGVVGFGAEEGAVQGFTSFELAKLVLTRGRYLATGGSRPADGTGAFTGVFAVGVSPPPKPVDTSNEKLDLLVILAATDVLILELLDKPRRQERSTNEN
jgi:hypothetical protein